LQGPHEEKKESLRSPWDINFVVFVFHLNLYSFSSSTQDDVGTINYVTRDPIGVAGLISPWNLPLYLLTFKIAPCIAAGNVCVCKPSELTSVTAWMFCDVLNKAGQFGSTAPYVCFFHNEKFRTSTCINSSPESAHLPELLYKFCFMNDQAKVVIFHLRLPNCCLLFLCIPFVKDTVITPV
jgi:hypothetical protein